MLNTEQVKQLGFKYSTPLDAYEIELRDYCNTTLGAAAEKFDNENPHVYVLFAGFARTALTSGRKRFGIAAIWERMRWEMAFSTTEKEFKISNNHRAYYARKIMAAHKDFHGFFVIKAARQ